MALNRYFNPTVYQGNFYTPPLDLIKESLQMAQQRYDTNFVAAEEIKNKYINALQKDRARANELQGQWDSSIDNIVAKYSGDYSQATKDLNRLLSDIRKTMGPGGEGASIEYNHNTWTEHWNKVREGVQKGDYTQAQAQSYRDYFDRSYQGVGPKDPVTGTYNLVSPEPLAKYVDTNKIIQERAAKIPRRTKKIAEPRPIPGDPYRYMMVEEEVEYVDPAEAQSSFMQALVSDDGLLSMLEQNARFAGIDPQQFANDYLNNVVDSAIPLYSGVFKSANSSKLEFDQVAMKNLDHTLALKRQREREAAADRRLMMKDAMEKGLLDNPLAPAPKDDLIRLATMQDSQPFKKVDPVKGVGTGAHKIIGIPGIGPFAPVPMGEFTTNKVDEILAKPSTYKGMVNIELLEAAKMAAAQWKGKDGAKSRDMNALTWDIYNESLDRNHAGSGAYARRLPSSPAMQEEAARVLPLLESASLDVWKIDPATGALVKIEKAEDRATAFTDLYDKEKGKPKTLAIGKSSIQTGLPFGTVFSAPKGGYYIVGEPHEDIRNMNNEVFNEAFGFLRTPMKKGNFFHYEYNGQLQTNYGKVNYYPDPNTGLVTTEINYYDQNDELVEVPIKDNNGNLILKEDGKPLTRPATPADIEEVLLPKSVRKLFEPRGATAAQFKRYPEYLTPDE